MEINCDVINLYEKVRHKHAKKKNLGWKKKHFLGWKLIRKKVNF